MVTHIVHIQLLKIDATGTIDHLINIGMQYCSLEKFTAENFHLPN